MLFRISREQYIRGFFMYRNDFLPKQLEQLCLDIGVNAIKYMDTFEQSFVDHGIVVNLDSNEFMFVQHGNDSSEELSMLGQLAINDFLSELLKSDFEKMSN